MVNAQYLRSARAGVPVGTYYAGETEEQRSAMELQRRVGVELARQNPEIANLYRSLHDYTRVEEIAEMYISSIHSKEVARHAVSYALSLLIPQRELAELRNARQRRKLEIEVGGFESEECKLRARKGWEKRQEMYGTPLEALIKGRGQVPWSSEERATLYELTESKKYRKPSNTPDYERIAAEINNRFHEGDVRTGKSISNYYRDLRRKAKKHIPKTQ